MNDLIQVRFMGHLLLSFCVCLLSTFAFGQRGRLESSLWISYMLPTNEDLVGEARGVETKCMSTRTISNQLCQKPGCEEENELAFRRCIGVPGVTFHLAVCTSGPCDSVEDIGDIASDLATSPDLNPIFNRIPQPHRYAQTGSSVLVSSQGCVVTGDHGRVNESVRDEVCSNLAEYVLQQVEGAVKQGDKGRVQWFLDHGISLDFDNSDPRTAVRIGSYFSKSGILDYPPLLWAVEKKSVDMARFLITRGARVNAGYAGSTPLKTAIGDDDRPMVQFLISNGADPSLLCPVCFIGGSPEMLKYLLDHGADANGSYPDRGTALTSSVKCGDQCLESSQLLIEHGADVNKRDMYVHDTPLGLAEDREKGYQTPEDKTIQLLLAHGARKRN